MAVIHQNSWWACQSSFCNALCACFLLYAVTVLNGHQLSHRLCFIYMVLWCVPMPSASEERDLYPTFFFFFFLRAPLILDCSVLFTILCGNPFKQGGHVRYFPLPFTYFFFHAAQYLPWVLMVLVFKHHLFSIQHTVLASGTGCQNVEGNGRMLTMWFLFHAALNSERCTHPWSKC